MNKSKPEINKQRLWTGVVLGLFFAFIFYAFQYLLREVLRLMSTSERFDVWLLSDEEVFFYNWVYAALALLIGQSMALAYIFERPKQFWKGRLNRRNTIVNDQRVLQYSFLMWIFKLAFFYAVFFGDLPYGKGSHYAFSFYDTFSILLIMALIVLFFQSWNTIRLTFKHPSFKWMGFSFGLIFIGSLGMANINFIDYKGINTSLLSHNMEYTYNLQIPQIDYTNYVAAEDRFEYDIVRDTNDTSQLLIKVDDRMRRVFDQDGQFFPGSGWCSPDPDGTPVYLRMDKRVLYREMRKILEGFQKENMHWVYFAVLGEDQDLTYSAVNNKGISAHIQFPFEDSLSYKTYLKDLNNYTNRINVSLQMPGLCEINGVEVGYNQLEEIVFQSMLSDTNSIVVYTINPEISLQDYLIVRAALIKTNERLIDDYCWYAYGRSFYAFELADRESYLRKMFRLRIIELPARVYLPVDVKVRHSLGTF